ncbi:MAG: O-antigen ligase family protein, partial [Gammaproteobacteria bacterium]|nr:O-antigen ligase family protein [Gammaproteobacteria bacterium]
MQSQSLHAPQSQANSSVRWLLIISALFLIFHFTGDHVFNKTNTLKIALLAFSTTLLLSFQIIADWRLKSQSSTYNLKVLFLLSLPIIATFPGLVSSQGQYDYAMPYELTGQALCVIWAYLIYSRLSDITNFDRFIWYLTPTIAFVCVVALLEKFGYDPLIRFHINPFEAEWLNSPAIYSGTVERVKSTFGNINYFASFLIQLIPLIMYLLIITWQKNKLKNNFSSPKFLFLTVILFIMLLSLQYTGTRAAIAAFIVAIILFAIFYFFSIRRIPVGYLVLFLALAITISYFSDPKLGARFLHLFSYQAWQSRIIPWQAAWNSISEAPFLGYGIGSSYQLFFKFVNIDSRLWIGEHSYNHVHFELLEVMQEGGLLGLISYLAFWGCIFFFGWKLIRSKNLESNTRILALAIFCGLLAYHLHGLFSVAPRMLATRMVAYTLVVFLLILAKKHLTVPFVFSYQHTFKHGSNILLACSLCLIWIWLIPYAKDQYNYAEALASQDRDTRILKLADQSNNIYVLNEAAKISAELQNGLNLEKITNKFAAIFPGYRKTKYYEAYAQYLLGNFTTALEIGKQAQNHDLYLSDINVLLAKLSLEIDNEELFKEQLKIAIKALGCKTKLFECDAIQLNVLLGNMASPIQFILRNNKLNVFIDNAFFLKLKQDFHKAKHERNYVPQEQVVKFVNILGATQFFAPRSIQENRKISSSELK